MNILHMFEGSFSLDAAHLTFTVKYARKFSFLEIFQSVTREFVTDDHSITMEITDIETFLSVIIILVNDSTQF